MNKQKGIILILILISLLFILNYKTMDSFVVKLLDEGKYGIVDRVIDGDTIVVDGENIRLLGINTPERGEFYYSEAKEFLNNWVLNKTVKVESTGKDKYQRTLAYVFLGRDNVNLKIVENGFANPYFPEGEDRYSIRAYNFWDECIKKEINFCERSENKCEGCIEIKLGKKIVLKNKCGFECDLNNWEIKHEGRQKIVLNQSISGFGEKIVEGDKFWESDSDSLYLRDEKGRLVSYYHY
jgi:endonuclease YncB( thermonuclease family)